jgi:hypothetical protein
MFGMRSLLASSAAVLAAATLAACAASDTPTAPAADAPTLVDAAGSPTILATVRVRCEVRRSPARSKISVDGNNLSPRNGRWKAGVRSGGATVVADAMQGVGDEAEFDFSSEPSEIAQGATPIPANFIKVDPNGPDVQGAILTVGNQIVVAAGADCRVR